MKLLTANEAAGAFPPSYYADTAIPLKPKAQLRGDGRVDVCIIGGGFTGLSAAYHLARRGLNVAVLEAHRIGWGASGRNGGQLGFGQRLDQPDLEAAYGEDQARAMWDLAQMGVHLVKDLIRQRKIDCDLKPGVLHANHKPRFDGEAQALAAHMNRVYGHPLRYLPPSEMQDIVRSRAYSGGVMDPEAAHLHPLSFVRGLATAAEGAGAALHERTEVLEITPGAPAMVRSAHGTLRADFVLLACNGYLDALSPPIAARVMPINNFIIATEPLSAAQMDGILAQDVAVADSKFVVNYFRFSRERRLLFGGRESYGYRFPRDIKSFVRGAMTGIFPQTADLKIDYGWGGTLAITRSRLPCLRRLHPNIYSASGYSGHGLGLAVLSGKLMADAVAGQAEGFDVMARIEAKPFPGGARLRHPLLVAAMLWYALRDRL